MKGSILEKSRYLLFTKPGLRVWFPTMVIAMFVSIMFGLVMAMLAVQVEPYTHPSIKPVIQQQVIPSDSSHS